MALEDIKRKFAGKWKMDRSENFEEFLREFGMNFIVRKLAALASPTVTISVEGEIITIITDYTIKKDTDVFKLDEEFETEREGELLRSCVTWENGKLTGKGTPINPNSKMKSPSGSRELVGEEMVETMYLGDVVCKRYFRRLE